MTPGKRVPMATGPCNNVVIIYLDVRRLMAVRLRFGALDTPQSGFLTEMF